MFDNNVNLDALFLGELSGLHSHLGHIYPALLFCFFIFLLNITIVSAAVFMSVYDDPLTIDTPATLHCVKKKKAVLGFNHLHLIKVL